LLDPLSAEQFLFRILKKRRWCWCEPVKFHYKESETRKIEMEKRKPMDSGLINTLPYLILTTENKTHCSSANCILEIRSENGQEMLSILLKLYFNLQFLASIFFFQVPTGPLTSISSISQTLNLSTSR
jgi:hypothetical protein